MQKERKKVVLVLLAGWSLSIHWFPVAKMLTLDIKHKLFTKLLSYLPCVTIILLLVALTLVKSHKVREKLNLWAAFSHNLFG